MRHLLPERSCQTPDKNVGQCVHFSDCRFVLRQYGMYKEHMPPVIMRFLQRSRCRPKVDGYHLCCLLQDVIPANANSKLK
ncbi:GH19063 [Drosophila grimshawi]|uniref:GH19063 n=1 Tax=Drosophila grimshawi TaxID=7222 RepID=B4JIB1_DROGR|nr:GH19063 [Drosophila grimshawi]